MSPAQRRQQAQTPAPAAEPGRVLTQATLRAGELLGLQQGDVAHVIGVSAATVSRMKSGTLALEQGTTPWQLAALFVRLFRSLDSITGGRDDASRAWLQGDNAALNGRPAELICNIEGLVRVVQYLDATRARL